MISELKRHVWEMRDDINSEDMEGAKFDEIAQDLDISFDKLCNHCYQISLVISLEQELSKMSKK